MTIFGMGDQWSIMDTVIVIPKDSFNIRNQLDKGYKTTENLNLIPTKVTSRDFNFVNYLLYTN